MTPLFAADNLCRVRAELEPAVGPRSDVARDAAARLGVRADRVSATTERNGVTECFVVHGERPLFVKTSHGPGALDRFRVEAERSLRLYAAGAPVPRALGPADDVDGVAVIAFDYVDGEHFTGEGRQLELAARGFGELARVAARVIDETAPAPDVSGQLVELRDLVRRGLADARSAAVLAERAPAIERAAAAVSPLAAELVRLVQPVHVDYHPLNLLFAGEVLTILDFEDLLPFPLAIAAGFGGFKLLRRAAVGRAAPEPRLVGLWTEATGLGLSRSVLAAGARARTLGLLHLILAKLLDEGDDRFLFDLGKHARALDEIDVIFGPAKGD